MFRRHFATPLEPGRCYPFCVSGRRAVPPEDCGGPWAFLELRQHYAMVRIADRLLELLKPIWFEAGQEDDAGDDDEHDNHDGDAVDDHHEELVHLLRWLKIDRFDQRAANRRLAQLTMERVA